MPYRRQLPQIPQEQRIPTFLVVTDRTSFDVTRTVLLVNIMNHQSWESGQGALMEHIKHQTKAELVDNARERVYWIGVIGAHWRYGVMVDGEEDPTPLIPWHHVTHDDASYHDFEQLRTLVDHIATFTVRKNQRSCVDKR
jgi:hypothetical protein